MHGFIWYFVIISGLLRLFIFFNVKAIGSLFGGDTA